MATDYSMQIREFRVQNKLGLHARPAAMLVKAATSDFQCKLYVPKYLLVEADERQKKRHMAAAPHIPYKGLVIKPEPDNPDMCEAGIYNSMFIAVSCGQTVKLGLRGARAAECFGRLGQLFAVEFARIDAKDERNQKSQLRVKLPSGLKLNPAAFLSTPVQPLDLPPCPPA